MVQLASNGPIQIRFTPMYDLVSDRTMMLLVADWFKSREGIYHFTGHRIKDGRVIRAEPVPRV